MIIRLLKAIVELIEVSAKLAYVFVFYPNSTPTKRAKKILDPQYNPNEYGSGETGEALKDEWIQGNIVTKETDYTFDPIVVESTKKILKES